MARVDMVKSVDRAATLLDLLTEADGGTSLGDLSRAACLPKSTTHRLLQTLMAHRLVDQDQETGDYLPGFKLFEMAYRVLNRMELRTQALPVLERLNQETNFTIHLAILDDGEVVYIEKREADRPFRMYSAVGKRAPAHCTALGKVLLAYLPEEEVRQIIARRGMGRHTANTITVWEDLVSHLSEVRRQGYALDRGEHEEMIRCVAAPIRDHTGQVVAGMSLTGTINDLSLEQAQQFAPHLLDCAEEISRRVGYVGSAFSSPTE